MSHRPDFLLRRPQEIQAFMNSQKLISIDTGSHISSRPFTRRTARVSEWQAYIGRCPWISRWIKGLQRSNRARWQLAQVGSQTAIQMRRLPDVQASGSALEALTRL